MRVHELLKVSHVDQAELLSDGKFQTGALDALQIWPCLEASECSLIFLGGSVNEPVVRDDVFVFQRLIS